MSQNGAKPTCSATTKAGKPCKGVPIAATDFKTCVAHAPANVRESLGFIAANGKAGRPRLKRPVEVAQQLIEDNIAVVLRPHFRTLGFDLEIVAGSLRLKERENGGAKLYGESKEGHISVSPHDDLGAMIAAAEKLLDRIYGRPKQATEITGAGGGPIQTEELIPQDADFHLEAARLVREAEAVAASAADPH